MNNELAPNILISSSPDGTMINEHYLISPLLRINNKLAFNENYLLQLESKLYSPIMHHRIGVNINTAIPCWS